MVKDDKKMKWNLQSNFTKTELKTEYRRLCKVHHPDQGGTSENFRLVQEEYQRLKPKAKAGERTQPGTDNKIYRVTEGKPDGDVTLYVPGVFLEEGGVIMHTFTEFFYVGIDETVQRLSIPKGAVSGCRAAVTFKDNSTVVFTIREEMAPQGPY